jgi:predicted nucleotidyltransferase
MERFGRQTIGPTIDGIKMEIRSIITKWPDVYAFGFGSFFRGEPFDDIDVLLVLQQGCQSRLNTYYELKTAFDNWGKDHGVHFDLIVLTEREFSERPLRDMDSLIPIVVD